MLVLAGNQFVVAHPDGAQNADIQWLVVLGTDFAAKTEAQISDVVTGARRNVARHVHADQGGRREIVGGFFQRFADDRLLQRFMRIQMAGRLVKSLIE